MIYHVGFDMSGKSSRLCQEERQDKITWQPSLDAVVLLFPTAVLTRLWLVSNSFAGLFGL